MTLNYLRIVGPFFDYIINYDYIINELCVEKDEVVNDCCGSCVVTENLENVLKDEEQNAPQDRHQERSVKELMPHFVSSYDIPVFDFFYSISIYPLIMEYPLNSDSEPDIPPPKHQS